jgi:CheY-like chemotaxis protein
MAPREKPDLVILDLSMPVMDGWEAAKRLRANPDTANIPILALSSHGMDAEREKAFKAGCNEFEQKPVQPASLIEKINTLLESAGSHSPGN